MLEKTQLPSNSLWGPVHEPELYEIAMILGQKSSKIGNFSWFVSEYEY